MQSDWIKIRCRSCNSPMVIHKDWNNPLSVCGVCKLISDDFVSIVEIIIRNSYSSTSDYTSNKLKEFVNSANSTYNAKLNSKIEKVVAWRIAERELADRVWNDKEIRKDILFKIKELRIAQQHEKEDKRAYLRNELRTALIADGKRRWSG